jgi:hypothetical protein
MPSKKVVRPARLQLVRRRGFHLRESSHDLNGLEAIIVARPGKWGNPFVVTGNFPPGTRIGINFIAVATVEQAVGRFRAFLEGNPDMIVKARRELAGRNLACWCEAASPCHADVLLDIANQ